MHQDSQFIGLLQHTQQQKCVKHCRQDATIRYPLCVDSLIHEYSINKCNHCILLQLEHAAT